MATTMALTMALRQWLLDAGVSAQQTSLYLSQLPSAGETLDPKTIWNTLAPTLSHQESFSLQASLYAWLKQSYQHETGHPLPAWSPNQLDRAQANLTRVMENLGYKSYQQFYQFSIDQREPFWELVRKELGIVMQKPPAKVYDEGAGSEGNRWWPEAQLNIAESCFRAPPDQVALVWQKEGQAALCQWTYGELNRLSAKVSSALARLGLQKGDRIAIDMPMTAESVAIYLGIVRMGAVVISIADSFAAQEIETRLRLGEAKAVFTQDYIARGGKRIPLLERVLAAQPPQAIVLPLDPEAIPDVSIRNGDLWWSDFLSMGREDFAFVACNPEDEVNILFSSGTTGDPKAIPWSHLTPIKCAMDGFFHHDIHPRERVAWPTNLGWMMGPWLIFASLINRATVALYEGLPTSEGFGRFIELAQVQILGLVPSIVKAWRASQCMEKYNWRCLRLLSSTGEASSPDDYLYLMSLAHYRPIIEYCGGTEIGGGYISGTVLQEAVPSAFTTPTLGLEVLLLDEEHQETDQGEVYIVGPSVGLSNRLLNRDHHEIYYHETPQFQGKTLRRHGDEMVKKNGYWQALGRVDDTMNLGGIKVSSAEIERCLNAHPAISETAAIAMTPPGGGPSQLVICAVLRPDVTSQTGPDLQSALQKIINQELNPLFRIQRVEVLERLPRTASNKVMRRVLRHQLMGEAKAEKKTAPA